MSKDKQIPEAAKTPKAVGARRSTRSSIWLAILPPILVFVGGLAIGITWDQDGAFGRSLKAALVSTAGPFAFFFEAGPFVRLFVALGILVIYVMLMKKTPLGRAKGFKVVLGSLVWCAIGFAAFVAQSGE